jgi:hypothetical protein
LRELDPDETGIAVVMGPDTALGALSVLPRLRQLGITPILDRMTFRFVQWVDEQARVSGRWPAFRGLRERLDLAQGVLAHELLGSLPAFPDAALDVVFDVRDRLQGPRTRFRAAVAETAEDLADVPDADLHGAIAELRRTRIEPGIQEIRETLDELRAAPSLLRIVSDRATVASATASLALIAGAATSGIDVGAAVQTVAGASSLGSGAAIELRARRELRRGAARQPWYLLHELSDGAVRGPLRS